MGWAENAFLHLFLWLFVVLGLDKFGLSLIWIDSARNISIAVLLSFRCITGTKRFSKHLFAGKCSVTAIVAILGIISMKYDPQLHLYAIPLLLCFVFAYFISHCVLSLYEVHSCNVAYHFLLSWYITPLRQSHAGLVRRGPPARGKLHRNHYF